MLKRRRVGKADCAGRIRVAVAVEDRDVRGDRERILDLAVVVAGQPRDRRQSTGQQRSHERRGVLKAAQVGRDHDVLDKYLHAGIAQLDQPHADVGIEAVRLVLDQPDHARRVQRRLLHARLVRVGLVRIGRDDQVHGAQRHVIAAEVIGLAQQLGERIRDDVGRRPLGVPVQTLGRELSRFGRDARHSRRHFRPSARINSSAEGGPGVPAM